MIVTYDALTAEAERLGVPHHLGDEVARYVIEGRTPGKFAQLVLADRVHEAVRVADSRNRAALGPIVQWVIACVPEPARGSDTRVIDWASRPDVRACILENRS